MVDTRLVLACAAAGFFTTLKFGMHDKRAQSGQNDTERGEIPSVGLVMQIFSMILCAISIIASDYLDSAADAKHHGMWAHIALAFGVYLGCFPLLSCFQGNESVAACMQL
eukprot:jgi/Chrzof1/6182/Cz17g14170.t1